MPSRRARILIACAVVQSAAACSLITDYSLPGVGDRPPSEASADDAPAEKADDGSAPRDASAEVDAPACTENPCVVELAAAGQTTCARTNDGIVRCWGLNNTGATGGGTAGDYAVPTKVAFDGPVDEISLGDWGNDDATACARRGALVECWGQDGAGRKLGRGGAVSDGNFVPVPAPVSGAAAALSLAVSSDRVCARVGGDRLACWGKMYDKTIQPSAVTMTAPGPVTQIVGGRQHDCVLLESKEVACAGYTYSFKENWPDGGVGPGQTGFVRVAGVTGIVQIATMGNFVCALKAGGSVLCWGRNKQGQLGRGDVGKESTVPAPVALPRAAKAIGTGQSHACAVLEDDTVWCWGRNGGGSSKYDGTSIQRGQVGALANGGLDDFTSTARKIGGLPSGTVRAVVGGYAHSCALTASGAAYCWGSNAHGELGLGNVDGGVDGLAHPTATRVRF